MKDAVRVSVGQISTAEKNGTGNQYFSCTDVVDRVE